jgi:hypothetical protein
VKKFWSKFSEHAFGIFFAIYFLAALGGLTALFSWLTYVIFTNHMHDDFKALIDWLWGGLCGLTAILAIMFGFATIVTIIGYMIIIVSKIATGSSDPFTRD